MKKIQSIVLGVGLSNIVNDKDGTVKDMTKIIYTLEREDTDKLIGPAILECYKLGNYIDKLKPYILKNVSIELEERPTKNGSKYCISKINNMEL